MQLGGIGVFKRVLKLGATDPVFDRQILHRLHVQRDPVHPGGSRRKPPDQVADLLPPLIRRLHVDIHPPAVQRRIRAIDPNEGRQAFDRRFFQKGRCQSLLAIGHRLEGHGLRGFGDAENHARILDRKEAFRDDDEQHQGQDQRAGRKHQRRLLPTQHPAQTGPVAGDDPVQHPLRRPGEPAGLFLPPAAQQPGAHHRRERQGDDGGDEDGNTQRHGKLTEQSSHHIAHEEQRNQHGDQRDGQGENREAQSVSTP